MECQSIYVVVTMKCHQWTHSLWNCVQLHYGRKCWSIYLFRRETTVKTHRLLHFNESSLYKVTNRIYVENFVRLAEQFKIVLFLQIKGKKHQTKLWSITHHHQHRNRIYIAIVPYIGVRHHCLLQTRYIVYRPQQRATNTWGNWWNSIRWILNLQCGKWFICSYHHKSCTEILAIENVSKYIPKSIKNKLIISTTVCWLILIIQRQNLSLPVMIQRFWYC